MRRWWNWLAIRTVDLAQRQRASFGIGLGLVLVLFVFNPDVFLLHTGLLAGDYRLWHFPLTTLLACASRTGAMTLWTSYVGCGFPVFAEGQIALLYPLNWLWFRFWPGPLAAVYNSLTLFQYVLAGGIFYAYVRNLKLSRSGAFLATCIYLFGSCQGGYFCNANSQKVAAIFPLLLLLIDRLWREHRHTDVFWIGVLLGVQLLAGHPQTFVYSLGFAGVYYLARYLPVGGPAPTRQQAAVFLPVHLGVIALATLTVALPQVLATAELAPFSNRLALPESFAYVGSLPPQGFLTLVAPFLSVYLSPMPIYVGVLGLFLVYWAWRHRSAWSRELWLVFWLGMLAGVLALGGYNPLYVGLIKLTHIHGLRVPARSSFFLSLCLAVLAGWGWDRWRAEPAERNMWRALKPFLFLLGLLLLAGLCLEPLLRLAQPVLNQLGQWVIAKKFSNNPLHPYAPAVYQEKLRQFLSSLLAAGSIRSNPWLGAWLAMYGTVLGGLAVWTRTPGSWRKVLTWAGAALLLADLYAFHANGAFRYALRPFTSLTQEAQPWTAALVSDRSYFRIYEYCTDPAQRETFPLFFDSGVTHGWRDVGIYSPLALDSHRQFFTGLGANDNSLYLAVAEPGQFAKLRVLLDVAAVKYVLSPSPLPGSGWVLRAAQAGFGLYENTQALPHAFWLPGPAAKATTDFNAYVRTGVFQPRRELMLSPADLAGAGVASRTYAQDVWRPVGLVQEGEDRVSLEANFSEPGWVVLSDTAYPGWQATVNGAAARIFTANGMFRAVWAPAGRQRVEFVYAPSYRRFIRSSRIGQVLLLVGWLGLCLLIWLKKKNRPVPL